MRKAVRVEARQQMPSYRKPASFRIKESYPLPPFSSVIGLAHTLCGWTSYHKMDVGVQGTSASVVSDYATNYAFGPVKFEAGRHAFGVDRGDGQLDGVSRSPRNYELLTDVTLVLHIAPEDASEIPEILEAFRNPPVYPSLGRYEDLLSIDRADEVALSQADDILPARNDMYLPVAAFDDDTGSPPGTVYRIGKVFGYQGKKKPGKKGSAPENHTQQMRVFTESALVRHIAAGESLPAVEGLLVDDRFLEPVFLV